MRIPVRRPQWKCPRHNRYFGLLYDATPDWLSPVQVQQYYAVYREAKRLRKMGRRVEVDHIVPIRNPIVCGLNVPWNLRIVDRDINQRKSNVYWPDMPNEQLDMFGREEKQPVQLRILCT
jgi:hypothetical protein